MHSDSSSENSDSDDSLGKTTEFQQRHEQNVNITIAGITTAVNFTINQFMSYYYTPTPSRTLGVSGDAYTQHVLMGNANRAQRICRMSVATFLELECLMIRKRW